MEAVQRKGKGAVGFYGSERSERSLKDFPVDKTDEVEDKKFQVRSKSQVIVCVDMR